MMRVDYKKLEEMLVAEAMRKGSADVEFKPGDKYGQKAKKTGLPRSTVKAMCAGMDLGCNTVLDPERMMDGAELKVNLERERVRY